MRSKSRTPTPRESPVAAEPIQDIEHAWDAAFNCTTGAEDRKLTLGNPTEPAGKFYNAHRKGSGWHAVKIASTDIPNVQERRTVVGGLLTVQGVGRFVQEYGDGSPFVQSRVHAEFPETAEDSLVQRDWLDAAVARWKAQDPYRQNVARFAPAAERGARVIVGCDPARLGPDRSVLCVRRGRRVLRFVQWRNLDTMQTADRVVAEVRKLLGQGHPVEAVWIDEIGVGAGVLDRLKALLPQISYDWMAPRGHRRDKVQAYGFDAGKRAGLHERFTNMKAQGYWHLRKLLEEDLIDLPEDKDLIEELMQTRVLFGSDGRTSIEAKDEIKKRLGRSPDKADALAVSLAPKLDDGRPRLAFRSR